MRKENGLDIKLIDINVFLITWNLFLFSEDSVFIFKTEEFFFILKKFLINILLLYNQRNLLLRFYLIKDSILKFNIEVYI